MPLPRVPDMSVLSACSANSNQTVGHHDISSFDSQGDYFRRIIPTAVLRWSCLFEVPSYLCR